MRTWCAGDRSRRASGGEGEVETAQRRGGVEDALGLARCSRSRAAVGLWRGTRSTRRSLHHVARDTYLRDMRVPASGRACCSLARVAIDKDVTVYSRDTFFLPFGQRGSTHLRIREIGIASRSNLSRLHLIDGGRDVVLLFFDPLVCPARAASSGVPRHWVEDVFVAVVCGRGSGLSTDGDGGSGCRGL